MSSAANRVSSARDGDRQGSDSGEALDIDLNDVPRQNPTTSCATNVTCRAQFFDRKETSESALSGRHSTSATIKARAADYRKPFSNALTTARPTIPASAGIQEEMSLLLCWFRTCGCDLHLSWLRARSEVLRS